MPVWKPVPCQTLTLELCRTEHQWTPFKVSEMVPEEPKCFSHTLCGLLAVERPTAGLPYGSMGPNKTYSRYYKIVPYQR